MSTDVDSFKKLVAVYDKILTDEVRDHVVYGKVLLATGFGLILVGVLLAQYYFPLGVLLMLVGVLRAINSLYDFTREDSLKKKMRLVRKEFGDVLLNIT